jgi:capsular polysaccharide transport system ATP-binding protein
MIIVSHDLSYIRAHCGRAAVLERGQLHIFESVDEAADYYTKVMT